MSSFPENSRDREDYIKDQIWKCNFSAAWVDITYDVDGHQVVLKVMDDALKVDGVRVNVSATLSQELADVFDASLPTSMVTDVMYACATRRAEPRPQPISNSAAAMIKHSEAVEKQVGSGGGLAATVGKHWVLDKKLESSKSDACNYGWHFTGANFQGIRGSSAASKYAGVDVRVIQPNATAHDRFHCDYSQICQLVSQQCWVDGQQMRFSDVLKDPSLASLISHQGALSIDRQPGVAQITGQYILFPVTI